MLWDLIFSEHGFVVFQNEKMQLEALNEEIRLLRQEEQQLKSEIIRLREDPKALEEVIHQELGYVYPDEYMLIMPEDEGAKASPDAAKEEETNE